MSAYEHSIYNILHEIFKGLTDEFILLLYHLKLLWVTVSKKKVTEDTLRKLNLLKSTVNICIKLKMFTISVVVALGIEF